LELRKGKLLHDGKTKKMYAAPADDRLILSFKDNVLFYDSGEITPVKNRGKFAASVSATLFRLLENYHILTHFIQSLKPNEMVVQKLDMFPLQVVVWNCSASHFSKRYGIEKGKPLDHPVIEFCWKNPKVHNPTIGLDHAIAFSLAKEIEMSEMVAVARKINAVLKSFFERRNLILADFQLEFGKSDRGILVGDEISLDTCRLWDVQGGQTDMNRFRLDRGNIPKAYKELFERIGVHV